MTHSVLLAYSAWCHSPTKDEVAHLPAGLAIWKYQDFSLYRVNPPLVRLVAAVPVLSMDHKEDWHFLDPKSPTRREWAIGRGFMAANGEVSFWLFTVARWACIPFSLLGLWVCYRWGTELGSAGSGLLVASLWCFSPNIMGHGSLITPEIAAVSCGLLAAWRFSKWQEDASFLNAFLAGIALGFALLVKSYWIILFAIWPLLYLLSCLNRSSAKNYWKAASQLALILILGLNLLNLGYLCKGSFAPLEEYDFYSRSLSGDLRIPGQQYPGNRFTGTWLGKIPVPLPVDYVQGIDLQKIDFEVGRWSYFFGEVREPGGWWQYYLVGLFLKVPLATWGLFLMGGVTLFRMRKSLMWRQLIPLIFPACLLLLIASMQTGMNRHIRYVFPLLPVVYLVGAYTILKWKRTAILLVCFTTSSSLSTYPHSLSFFNLSIGGPSQGYRFLIDSNLDWGQDMLFIKKWIYENPDKRPVRILWAADFSPRTVGINASATPLERFKPGWYIISRSERFHPSGRYRLFDDFSSLEQIGYTHDVYYLHQEQTNDWQPD